MRQALRDICIIGGTGFIGTALRRHLRDEGFALTIIGRRRQAAIVDGEQYLCAQDWPAVERQLSGRSFAAMIDLAYATVPNTSYADPVADFSENLGSLIRHLELATKLNIGIYVLVSSGGTIYGNAAISPIHEGAATSPISPYGITKLACENYTHMFYTINGLNTLIVRPSNVYGPGQIPFRGQGLIATALGSARESRPLVIYGDGSHVRDYLHIDDFCGALSAIMRRGTAGQTYNIGSATGATTSDVLQLVQAAIRPDGAWLDLAWAAGRPYDVESVVLDTRRLNDLTGWVPTISLEDGILATWNWIKAL